MSMKDRISFAYQNISNSDLYLIGGEEGVYIESPEDQGLMADDVQNSVLRVFLKKEEAQQHRSNVEVFMGPMKIVKTSIVELWPFFSTMNKGSQENLECPMRVDLCHIGPDSWPETTDILWSPDRLIH